VSLVSDGTERAHPPDRVLLTSEGLTQQGLSRPNLLLRWLDNLAYEPIEQILFVLERDGRQYPRILLDVREHGIVRIPA
jgi:hypothetical protein